MATSTTTVRTTIDENMSASERSFAGSSLVPASTTSDAHTNRQSEQDKNVVTTSNQTISWSDGASSTTLTSQVTSTSKTTSEVTSSKVNTLSIRHEQNVTEISTSAESTSSLTSSTPTSKGSEKTVLPTSVLSTSPVLSTSSVLSTSPALSTSSVLSTSSGLSTSPITRITDGTPGATSDTFVTSTSSSDDCASVIGLSAGVAGGLIVILIVIFIVICTRMRRKWMAEIKEERRKTELWAAATYSNTIVNEHFMDYQLASPNLELQPTGNFVSFDSPHRSFAFDYDGAPPVHGAPSIHYDANSGTLRRNTYTAPEDITHSSKSCPERNLEPLGNHESRLTQSCDESSRGRSSTFTTGKKFKIDKHVLLKHEEELDRASIQHLKVTSGESDNSVDVYTTEL